ncbi:subtilisin-like serine protease [Tulasnella sp. JGI-2019a]|nr:subtilisin-like serine protease [Tulasnella sp. JGI-2019a]KAG9004498.1 subtilisin-like serine protease [Tulasnella sp. JGI-2019a]
MHSFSFFATLISTLLALVAVIYAAPTPKYSYSARHINHPAARCGLRLIDGDVRPNSYVVKLASTTNRTQHVSWAHQLVANSTATKATSANVFANAFHGYVAELDDDKVMEILTSGEAEWVEEDAILHTTAIQTGATWGLQRISSSTPLPADADPLTLSFTYKSNDAAGKGVDVYVIDTGLLATHNQFGGRAKMVFTAPGLNTTDDNGHGSHVAGTVGGTTVGVAKGANLLGVKVIAADGSGSSSDIISGIDFAIQAAKASGRPSVISMSIGGAKSQSIDAAAVAAISAGIHVVAAAGNDSQDAANDSPASAPGVIAVGSMNIANQVSSFSNFGSTVDIFAPGEDIISCGITSNTAAAILSGTSQATPHISGLVALLLSEASNITPTQMVGLIKQIGLSGQLSSLPSSTTTNLIAQNFVANTNIPQF